MDKILLEIYEEVKDGCRAVLLTGSSVLPYIKNPRDEDYVFLYKDAKSARAAEEKILARYSWVEMKQKFHWDIHIRTEVGEDNYGYNNQIKVIIGDKTVLDELPKLLDNIEYWKQRCVEICEHQKHIIEKFTTIAYYFKKIWYYVYRMVAIINNNSYELTEKQIEEINILHDKKTGTIEEKKLIIDRLLAEVDLWH